MKKSDIKVILIHGNGGSWPKKNWLPKVASQLRKLGIKTIFRQFPDPKLARAKYWLPFIKKLGADKNTILIGHSSGAIASMRYAETNEVLGSILVSAYFTDLGQEDEKRSGYFNKPWNWSAIRKNQKWIVQFASKDDPLIPIGEAREVHSKLKTEYFEYKHQGHFSSMEGKKDFSKIVSIIKSKIEINS